jgi:membrane protein YqaA with SNARE-associated domain
MNYLQLFVNNTSVWDTIAAWFEHFRIFWESYGKYGLFVYSIIETITPLAGVEVFFVTLVAAGSPWWRVALVTTIANVVGAAIVYFFMAKENNRFYKKILKPAQRERTDKLFKYYGVWAIFIFAMTPLPFFLILFVASLAKMDFKKLMLAVFFSRGFRFFITTVILHQFSDVSPLMLVLILFLIALPVMAIMYFGQKKMLAYFETKANQTTNDGPLNLDNEDLTKTPSE